MITRFIFLVAAILLANGSAFAMGGNGATCNPSTPNWGSCELAPIPFQSSVTNTVNVTGGNYITPFQATQANTHYILQGNMTANGTAIEVNASYVIIDLNGYSITYNETTPGEGVSIGAVWNTNHVAVINGSIIQGSAMSEGDQYGNSINPVSTCSRVNGNDCRPAPSSHISNLYVRYSGKDISGIKWTGDDNVIEQCTVEDTYEFGELKNRHQGVDGITSEGNNATIRNNTIINARQRGIKVYNNSNVYDNSITIRSIAVNSYGIFGWITSGNIVHSNTIIARGEHPIGIGFVGDGTSDIDVYNNYIDSKTTALGVEYSSEYLEDPLQVIRGNFAVGFRTTWGATALNVYDNEIHVYSDSNFIGTYSPTGATAYINAGARGLMVGTTSGKSAIFANNQIYAIDKDGTGKAYGMVCTSNESDSLFFIGNTVTANITNIVVGDEYDPCSGFPLFLNNTLVKSGNHTAYRTITNQLYGWFDSEARFVDSVFFGGASAESVELNPSGEGLVNIYFGSIDNNEFRYIYRLHDNSNTSSALLLEDFDPAITLGYGNPATLSAARRFSLGGSLIKLAEPGP